MITASGCRHKYAAVGAAIALPPCPWYKYWFGKPDCDSLTDPGRMAGPMLHDTRPAMLLLLIAALALIGCEASAQPDPVPAGPPALAAAPDKTPTQTAETADPTAKKQEAVLYDSGVEEDNASCMICHIDFEKEPLASQHLEAGITCMACHGDSDVHRADEFNIMTPDVIWGRAEIDAFCKQCHEKHKQPEKVEAFLTQWESKRRPNRRWIERESVCTDCHGNHAIVGEEGAFR